MDETLRNSIKRVEGQWSKLAEPHRDPTKPIQTNWGAVLGMLGFIAGIILPITQKNNSYIIIIVAGFGLAAGSLYRMREHLHIL